MSEPTQRPLTREELGTVVDWAAAEGWNPGLHDAKAFWDTDPQGFAGIEADGHLVGAVSAVSFGRDLGFLGLFIVKPQWRGQGLGRDLWDAQIEQLETRLASGAPIGLDGVLTMADFYGRCGFVRSHDNIRMTGSGPGHATPSGAVVPIADVPFDVLVRADATHAGARRDAFWRGWIAQPGSVGLALMRDGGLQGFAVMRRCLTGHKVGPLFAGSSDDAATLLGALRQRLSADEPFFLDVPECNSAAMALAADNGLTEVFRCVRMYRGSAPAIDWDQIYGVTTFELG